MVAVVVASDAVVLCRGTGFQFWMVFSLPDPKRRETCPAGGCDATTAAASTTYTLNGPTAASSPRPADACWEEVFGTRVPSSPSAAAEISIGFVFNKRRAQRGSSSSEAQLGQVAAGTGSVVVLYWFGVGRSSSLVSKLRDNPNYYFYYRSDNNNTEQPQSHNQINGIYYIMAIYAQNDRILIQFINIRGNIVKYDVNKW